MKLGKTGQITSVKPICPNECCKKELDGFNSVDSESTPSPDAITICCYCGWVLKFNSDLTLGVLQIEEYMKMSPETQNTINNAQQLVVNLLQKKEMH